MIESFVEALVVVEFADFDRWACDNVCAVAFENFRQLFSLRRCTGDDDGSSLEWFRHCTRVLAPRAINVEAREDPISSALSGVPDKESWSRLDPSGRATRPSSF